MSFDWDQVVTAAKEWMADHADTPPRWLVLPWDTSRDVAETAAEIYECPYIYGDGVETPYFTTIEPSVQRIDPADPDRLDPLDQPSAMRFNAARLREKAIQGVLTTEDIKNMSMEEYAAVRDILLGQVPRNLDALKKI